MLEKVKVFTLGVIAALLAVNLVTPKPASGQSSQVGAIMAPQVTITLVANVVQKLPLPAGSSAYCSATVFNNTATPVYPGQLTGVGIANAVGAIPFCTNTALCPSSSIEANAASLALVATVGVVGIRWNYGVGCT